MENYIDIENLVIEAEKSGIQLGKGDPYNRLRYYTKIGWLPHMTRKKTPLGVVGHYPVWVLKRLILIDKLKKQGLENDEISEKINTQNKLHGLYAKVDSQEFKNKITLYITLSLVLIVLLNELEIISLSKSKNQTIQNTAASTIQNRIIGSGDSFIPAGKNRSFIKTEEIYTTNRVNITFKQNFEPATRYWVSQIQSQKGFNVELDAPVAKDTEFSWIITQ